MAKKKKSKAKRAAAKPTEAVKPSEVMVLPNTPLIQRLSKMKDGAQTEIGEINDHFNAEMKPAVEKKGVCRWAFNQAHALKNMKPEKRSIAYFHLLRYMDDLKIPELATAQNEMFEEVPDAGEGEAESDTDETSSESRAEAAARDVTETAGGRLN